MTKARQVDGLVEQFHANELAALRQCDFIDRRPVEMWQMPLSFRGIRACLQRMISGADRESEACPKAVCSAHKIAKV